ncbi:succinoglycan biosynthesis transport protein ExoP [Rhodococcus sp. 27YEA15]|uniref:Wzz/FepE/Etk N-terminal domain-containing protein n=1 Tax=Rhodococcus sp. 27YEA15 TaxID=3156259 RepID=UPI003C79D5E3
MNALGNARRILARGWAILVFGVLGLAIGVLISMAGQASYTSTTVLFIGSPVSADSAGAYQGDLFSQQRAATYAQLFSSNDLAVKVVDDLNLPMSPHELATHVSAAAVEKTVLLQVSVSDSTAERAADIANAYAKNFAQYVGQLEKPNGGGQPNMSVQVVTEANPADATGGSSLVTTALMGTVGGIVVGAGVMMLLRRLDRSVKSAAMMTAVVDGPILATVPVSPSRGSRALQLPGEGSTPYAESVRKLRTAIEFADSTAPLRSVLITSPRYTEPAGLLAVDLAVVMSEAGRRVVVVDGDSRSPSLDSYLGVKPGEGLSDVLAGSATLESVLTEVPGRSLTVVTAGSKRFDFGDVVASPETQKLFIRLREQFDYLIVTGPPLAIYSDSAVIGAAVDAVVLVSSLGVSTTEDVEMSVSLLRSAGANLFGTVLSGGRQVRAEGRRSLPDSGEATPDQTIADDVGAGEEGPVSAWPPVKSSSAASHRKKATSPNSASAPAVPDEVPDPAKLLLPAKLAEPAMRDLHLDFNNWEPVTDEHRYTRSDVESPTVVFPRVTANIVGTRPEGDLDGPTVAIPRSKLRVNGREGADGSERGVAEP